MLLRFSLRTASLLLVCIGAPLTLIGLGFLWPARTITNAAAELNEMAKHR